MKRLKIIIAPDKFKSSLSALQFCQVLTQSITKIHKNTLLLSLPLSDGGDGFCEVLHFYEKLTWKEIEVLDPLFRPIRAKYLLSADSSVAYIEMARSSGLTLLAPGERSALNSTTFGLGQLILSALKEGAKTVYIGLGGSATNDGGLGMASALGYRFLDKKGKEIPPVGRALLDVDQIELPELLLSDQASFIALSDVDNSLHGAKGAAYQFAQQKGATESDLEKLDAGLIHLERKVSSQNVSSVMPKSGDGAAGGLGAACRWFLNAELQSGAEFMLKRSGFLHAVVAADLVITGEGRFDQQSLMGKMPGRLVGICKEKGVGIALIAGDIDKNTKANELFLETVSLSELAGNKEKAIRFAPHFLAQAGIGIIERFKHKLWTH
jgi:glycerate kinase